MSTHLTVVVTGLTALADALRSTGQFAQVHSVGSTAGLRDLLTSGQLSRAPDDKVFLFADSTPVDTEQTLPFLVTRLAAMGTPAIIIATSPAGRDLVRQCPGAGLLEGPLWVNQVLGALSGHRGLPVLTPVQNNVQIPLDGSALPTPAPAPAPAPATSTSSPFTASPAANPFAQDEPATGAPASPFGQQTPEAQGPSRPSAPGGGGFAAFASAPAVVPEDTGAPAGGPQASAPGAPASPFGQGTGRAPAASPFGQPSTEQTAPSPFSAPAADPEASPTPPSPFGQPGAGEQPSAPSSPFGPTPGQEQSGPAPASPFGSAPAEQPSSPASPFGQTPAAAVEPSPFGQGAPAQPSASPFGSAPAQSPFAQPANGGVDQPPFAAGPPGLGASPFGQPADVAHHSPALTNPVTQPYAGVAAPVSRVGAPTPGDAPQRRGHVVTVVAPKGGTGKSTMALNLAAYLGLRLRGTGRNVCLIDANVQQADTGKYLNKWTPNIEGLLKDPSAIHPDRVNDHLVHEPQLNTSFLLGPASPEVANPLYFSGKRYSQILDALKPNYDYILIDTPVAELYHELFRDFALPRADFLAVVITPNVTTLMNTDSWLRRVTAPLNDDGMGVDPAKVGIVLNRAEDDIGIDEDEVRRELGEWRFLTGVPETKEWKRCNNLGTLVATKNYHELNEAFSIVLQAATGEELVQATGLPPAKPAKGLRRFFKGRS